MAARQRADRQSAQEEHARPARSPGGTRRRLAQPLAEGDRDVGRGVGADRHEARVADRELAREAVDEVQAHREDDVDPRQARGPAGMYGEIESPARARR